MNARFGFRDFVNAALLLAILVSIWVAMKQYDRQWQRMKSLERQVEQLVSEQSQTRRQIIALSEKLEGGLWSSQSQACPRVMEDTLAGYDPFERIEEARSQPEYAQGDWMIDAFATNVSRVTPLITVDAYGVAIQNYVLEGLIQINPETLELSPLIAERWVVDDNREPWQAYIDRRLAEPLTAEEIHEESDFPKDAELADQEEYIAARLKEGRRFEDIINETQCPPATWVTFYLRRGVTFSDGVPLTSADVVFSFDLLNNPQINAPSQRQFYDNLKTCEALDELTVRFGIKQPHYEAIGHAGGRSVLPKHFYERFTPEQINQRPGLLLGSGPYRMPDPESWSPGKPVELVRNERYWGTPSAFRKLIWREINNDVARLTAFRNGEIDLFAAQPEQYEQLKSDSSVMQRSEAYAYDTVPTGYSFIAWNQQRNSKPTLFSDPRVRIAMTFLTPRDQIAKDIFLGYASPADGPFAPASPQHNPEISPRPFNVEEGRRLLREAGWEDRNDDGILEDADGRPFQFKLIYGSGSDLLDRIVLYLKDAYARAGIVMEPDPIEFSVMLERIDNQDFDAITLAWGGGAVERDLRQTFHSIQARKGGDNFMNYRNAELDRLIDEARRTLDDEQRMALWQACHRIIYDEQPYTFLFNRQTLRLLDKRFRNVEIVTAGMNDRTEWFTPASLQRWTD